MPLQREEQRTQTKVFGRLDAWTLGRLDAWSLVRLELFYWFNANTSNRHSVMTSCVV